MSSDDLSTFIEDITGESYLRVQENLGDGFVRLRAREAQRRQAKQDITCFEDVVLELLRNARDAQATAVFIATWKEQGRRYLTVIDNGSGIPEHLHDTVFEPFVTSKLDTFHEDRWGVHGRGMALYSIKENVEEAQVLFSHRNAGTSLAVHALTSKLSEKSDQSSMPYLHKSEEGEFVMRGPRNIARVAMEFALDAKDELAIYLGSPVEIAATLLAYTPDASFDPSTPIDRTDSDVEAITDQLKFVYDPEAFSEIASQIGLPLSTRSARRIIDGQITPLKPILAWLGIEGPKNKIDTAEAPIQTNLDDSHQSFNERLLKDQRKLKIAPNDLDKLSKAVLNALEELSQSYYLQIEDMPKIRATSEKITISIPIRLEH